jgi:nitrogen fixation protein FixH
MSTKIPQERRQRTFTGWHMFAVICGFFGTIIAANASLAYFAAGSWTGLVVENSYVASQGFNDQLDDARAQQAYGWQTGLRYTDGALTFTLNDAQGNSLSGALVEATLRRPVHEGDDHVVSLSEHADGTYGRTFALAPGIWEVEIIAQDATERRHRQIHRLWIRDGGSQ